MTIKDQNEYLKKISEPEKRIKFLEVEGEPHRRSNRRWNNLETRLNDALIKITKLESDLELERARHTVTRRALEHTEQSLEAAQFELNPNEYVEE